jgi:hypothetical protein
MPRNPSGRPGRAYRLKIDTTHGLFASEATPGSILPRFCPERHMNGDETFCLGLERFKLDDAGLRDFWAKLRAFLLCQDFAAKTGRWPTNRWLSHGPAAAEQQLAAEAAAARAGLAERYRRAIEFGEGWLAGPLQPKQQAGSPSRTKSARRHAIEELIQAERRRRDCESQFMASLKCWGKRCCGTMRACPLREEGADGAH